ncbi:tyrosine recombinase XerC [Acidihalobacter prosperus]|uniref:Tyrosine recombinase XerC n=1 Tax=Acidihalobacter prosperus TaxID=160660 RepID=A0A1A6C1H0_9GAMM|nr:tyrosine recombinase XerC [Acidihalobacter prosperus]OBS08390.1 site-specific tyrosine recombinase XerD [Acidihalobacter prosperus]
MSESAVEAYLDALSGQRQYSPHSVAAYRRDLLLYQAFLDARGRTAAVATAQDVREFIAGEHRKGRSATTLQRRLSAIRGFHHFLLAEGLATQHPALDLRAPKSQRRLPEVLAPEQLGQLLAKRKDDPLAVRDRAMFELMYSSGLRLAESVTLDLIDLDLGGGMVRVIGKGRKTRDVPVGRQARAALVDWLRARAELAAPGERAVFVGRGGKRLGERAVQQRLTRLARESGLDVPLHPHLLRHAFASHMLESSGDLRAVQELLGHANISTTQVYTHLDFQHLSSVYDQAHPRARRRKTPE